MKLIFIFGVMILLVISGNAQQDVQISHNFYNIMMYNPGYVGSKDAICATALNRQQWRGFDGAPVSSVFSASTPFRLFGAEHGAGVHIINDEAGFGSSLGINISYSYKMDIGPGKLGAGIGFGFINSSLDAEWFVPAGDSHTPPSGDPFVPAGNENALITDFAAGVFYHTENYYIGFSSTHINEPTLEYSSTSNPFLTRHYYFKAGYNFMLENPSFTAMPSLFLQSDGAISQLSIGGIVDYEDKLWGGVFYRFGSAIVGIAGVELFNGIKVGYSFDLSTTEIGKHNKGTHELMLRYCFDLFLDRSPQRYRSIRIL